MLQRLQRHAATFGCGTVLILSCAMWPTQAQTPASGKRPLSYDVYDAWWSIQGTTLSRNGEWLAYALTAQGLDGQLVVRNLRTGNEFRHPRGTNPTFTPDGRFVTFSIVPTKAEEEKEREAGRGEGEGQEPRGEGQGGQRNEPRNSAGIMELPGGKVTTLEKIGTISLPEESSTWAVFYRGTGGVATGRGGRGGRGRGGAPQAGRGQTTGRGRGAPGEKRKDPGRDLIVRNLPTGEDVTIPLVSGFAWSRDGAWLAYAVSSQKAEEDGAFARRMSDGAVIDLQKGKGNYKSFAFDEDGRQLAFLSDQAEYDKPVSPYRLYYWTVGDGAATELVSGSTRGMPDGLVVSDQAPPRFSKDGQRLFLGTAPPPEPPAAEGAPQPRAVDIWHYKDPHLQSMQRSRAQQERNRNYRAVVHMADRRLVQLATFDLPNVNPGDDATSHAVGTSDLPYRREVSWDTTYNDVSIVDLKTGNARKILERWRGTPSMSPDGRYLLYFDEHEADWFTHRVSDGAKVNLTGKLDINFWREDHDTPNLPGAYGSAGWTANDSSVLIYDKYDIWDIKPDGTGARMVTNGFGRREKIVFRYRSLDPEQRSIPTDKPLLLSANDDATESGGFYQTSFTGTAPPQKVVMLEKSFGQLIKARNADRLVFTLSRFDEFPDLWLSDASFKGMKKVSDANPQQAQFVWGRAELTHYLNTDGKSLRAIVIKPENFDPAKKYPLMVYIYEELSEGLHTYRTPNPGTSINITRYVSNGYVVLLPDIVYDTGYPGESAEKCVIPAVNTIVAQGYIDPKRIGIQGHSWGGYQITHLITRTKIFAAVQAGASVSNMISAYGGIRWGTGMSRAFQYERTQSRIGAPPWDAPLQFIENSPIFWVEKVETPYLTIHNDEDDAVPWYQAIEFFSAMRRLGKEAYFFNYNGEPHGLRNRDNQKHWTVHQDEFFDHFLLGKPRPEWMEKGVTYLERGRRDVSEMFKPKPAATTTQVSR
ncbi:MAG TPA: prolyl oligopeptidase family serine peptidase [Vicinamibacterales bacterium]|nr:prolyl oligopeptidase family serine peptidase [Vicinamibacterales bacterium]